MHFFLVSKREEKRTGGVGLVVISRGEEEKGTGTQWLKERRRSGGQCLKFWGTDPPILFLPGGDGSNVGGGRNVER